MNSSDPILLFDSGVGGLTVLAELRKLMPQAPVIYVADYAALPYGEKSEEEIAGRVPALLGRLEERYHPRLVTIACNTASTIALAAVREALGLPVVGTVPAIKPAAAMTRTGAIGLLGTAATIRQAYVDNLEAEFARDKLLLRHAAPGLVAAAEAKLRGEPLDPAVFAAAAEGLRRQQGGDRIDTVVLACTHFPLLEEELGTALGPDVTIRRWRSRHRPADRVSYSGSGILSRAARRRGVHRLQWLTRKVAAGAIDLWARSNRASVNALVDHSNENVSQTPPFN